MSHGKPNPPDEVPVNRSLDALAPKFRAAVLRVIERLERQGHDPIVAESLRTNARQRYLHGFGRLYDDGRGIVTHSQDGDESWHYFGLAVDIISRSRQWDAPTAFWRALEHAAEVEGLRSGRDWDGNDATRETFVDAPHLQWGPPMRRSPSPRATRLFIDGGFRAVWAEVGAD